MKIAFIGYNIVGDHVKKILEERYSNIEYLYFDDLMKEDKHKNIYAFKDYKYFFNKGVNFIITLGYKHITLRKRILNELISKNEEVLSVIDRNSIVADDTIIGKGVIIYSGVVIGNNVNICDGVILHNGVVISHDSVIGNSTYISPNSTVCGNVKINDCCFIGAGTSIANDVIIEDNCIIGIGSVVLKNLKQGVSAIGNPLKILNKKIKL